VTFGPGEPTITVTSEQFHELLVTWLGQEAQQALWHAIANAPPEDGDAAILAWQPSLAELSPQELAERGGKTHAPNARIAACECIALPVAYRAICAHAPPGSDARRNGVCAATTKVRWPLR
jgi:hypothetical protein